MIPEHVVERQQIRRAQVKDMTRFGKPAAEIAARLGVTERTVVRDRTVLGIAKPPPTPMTAAELDWVERLLDDGCSLREAARTVGRRYETLYRRFKGRGWTTEQVVEYRHALAKFRQLEASA